MEEDAVTDTSLPDRSGAYADNNGSALVRAVWISGGLLEMWLLALFKAKRCRCCEKSESVAKAGWTERTRSLERYAILATVFHLVRGLRKWYMMEYLVLTGLGWARYVWHLHTVTGRMTGSSSGRCYHMITCRNGTWKGNMNEAR